jgi:hypothetical protein
MVSDKAIFEIQPGYYGLDDSDGIPCNTPGTKYYHTLGSFICSGPLKPVLHETKCNQVDELNYTGPPGKGSLVYFKMVFQLPKWFYNVEKPDEWIEVTPAHRQYYEQTMSQKQMLEGVIKTGLSSAASAVADYELISHDMRKYKEIMNYFSKKDEHSLKAMFIDQVDIHTGEGMSMRTMAPRWPTIIADFIRLDSKDVDPDKIAKKLDIAKAEGVILATKNKLYLQWKELFGGAVRERFVLLRGLLEARKKTVGEYKKWLQPQIARYKLTRIGMERPAIRSAIFRTFGDVTGMQTFTNSIKIWAWKVLRPIESRRPPMVTKPGQKFVVYPYDSYIRDRFVLSNKTGLAQNKFFPWLRNPRKFCKKCGPSKGYHSADTHRCPECKSTILEDRFYADEIVTKHLLPMWLRKEKFLHPDELYYNFVDIDILRLGTKLQVGELEDITFKMRNYVISQNILLVKLLELWCRDKELDRYIEEMLGVSLDEKPIEELVKEEYPEMFGVEKEKIKGLDKFMKDMRGMSASFKKSIPLPKRRIGPSPGLQFIQPGPYEKDFYERITKQYLTVAGGWFNGLRDFLKDCMGVH